MSRLYTRLRPNSTRGSIPLSSLSSLRSSETALLSREERRREPIEQQVPFLPPAPRASRRCRRRSRSRISKCIRPARLIYVNNRLRNRTSPRSPTFSAMVDSLAVVQDVPDALYPLPPRFRIIIRARARSSLSQRRSPDALPTPDRFLKRLCSRS